MTGAMPAAWRWLGLLLCLVCAPAIADVFRPAYLELKEAGQGHYDVTWKVPVLGDRTLPVHVGFPVGTEQLSEPRGLLSGDAYIERWSVHRDGGLAGQVLRIDGVDLGITDVIVRIEHRDGTSQVERVLPAKPEFTVRGTTTKAAVAWSYLSMGVEHILGGIDHLLFVLSLLLIVRGARRIFATITAFTIAHSVTLVAATLGWVHVPGPPVEAAIALSIVFVAAEVVRGYQARPGLTARAPWVVAFGFGLLHGFGFAGALAEVGLPQQAIPVALFTFNVGVEIGQLIFVTFALGVGRLLSRLPLERRPWMGFAAPYAIGALAMFWVFDRVNAFLP